MAELTGGDSLAANIQLVLNIPRLAAAIALQYQRLGGYDPVVTMNDSVVVGAR